MCCLLLRGKLGSEMHFNMQNKTASKTLTVIKPYSVSCYWLLTKLTQVLWSFSLQILTSYLFNTIKSINEISQIISRNPIDWSAQKTRCCFIRSYCFHSTPLKLFIDAYHYVFSVIWHKNKATKCYEDQMMKIFDRYNNQYNLAISVFIVHAIKDIVSIWVWVFCLNFMPKSTKRIMVKGVHVKTVFDIFETHLEMMFLICELIVKLCFYICLQAVLLSDKWDCVLA